MARPGNWQNVILWSADTLPQPLVVDSGDGGLVVHVANGSTGGTSSEDESAFTAGSSQGTPLMVEFGGELLIAAGDANRRVQVAGVLSTTPPTASTATCAGPTVIGTSSAPALAANASRVRLVLQNVGTTQLYILEGPGSASSTSYTYILPMGGTTRDGSSPVVFDTIWKGAVQWASSAAGGLGIITEETA